MEPSLFSDTMQVSSGYGLASAKLVEPQPNRIKLAVMMQRVCFMLSLSCVCLSKYITN